MAVMQRAPLEAVGIKYSSIIVPFAVMRPILLAEFSVNQISPSVDTATPRTDAFGVGTANSTIVPSRSRRPSALAPVSTNQMPPSGCTAMARGWLSGLGSGNSADPTVTDGALY
jgi:hypothetical protein